LIDERESKKVSDISNNTEGGNVNINVGNISGVSGEVAVGEHIEQKQTLTLSVSDIKELLDSLAQFQKEIVNLGLPEDELQDINNDIDTATREAEKDEPNYSKIKKRFEGAIETVKDVGDTIEKVSKWEWTGKIVTILGKLGLSIAL
jgi:Asp-tRNA(Asn)/Glu-tRNA(Gln) amidotransferase A subunit family amidase